VINDHHTSQQTKKPSSTQLNPYILVKCLGNSAERMNVIPTFVPGKCTSKPPTTKERISLDNNDKQTIAPTYSKGGAWLKYVGPSNMLTACII